MKRPLVMVAMIYVSGVFLADRFALPLVASFAVSFIAGVMALVSVRQRKWLLPIFILLFGCFNFTVRTQVLSPFDLRSMAPRDPAFVRVEGRLRETPVLRVYERQGKSQIRSMARLQVNGIHLPTGWQEAFGELAISTHGELPSDFCLGARVEISGVLKQPMGPLAEGLFDYRTYLRRQGIFFQLEVSSPSDWQLISTSKSLPLSSRFGAWAQRTLARGLPEVDDSLRLLWAMVLGWKTALTDEVSEPFMRTGTLHIFAISGLHIALIAGILVALLRVAQCPRAVCGIVLIPLLWFYTAATGWQPSAIRSTIMMSIIIAGWSLRRPSDLVNSLAAAALLILIWDPQQLFQAGFQLSFFVVLSIALFSPHLLQYWQRLIRTDPFLPAELLPRWRRWLNDPLHYLGKSLATSIAAWLGSLPLIAHYFHLVTPVSLLVNLIIVPLSGLALMSSLGALVCGDWFPWCTERFNHCSWFLM
ncbi:MAG: ComEC/Rec2 family competence protein, partial [Verrucomicrobiota bacterium]